MNWIKETKGNKAVKTVSQAIFLTKITYLRKLAVEAVLEDSIAWIKDFLETGEKNNCVRNSQRHYINITK